MLKLLKLDETLFVLMIDGVKPQTGNAVITAARMAEMGIESREVAIGFEQLNDNLHDLAHYGAKGKFIFSKNVRDAA